MLKRLARKNTDNEITKSKISAGLVNFDQLLLSVKIIARVEGSYVVFKFQITKDNTLFTLKLRISTFKVLFAKLQKIAQEVEKDSKMNY